MKGEVVELGSTWTVGDRLDGGGFGQVYEVTSDSRNGAAKFVPQAPGADRELLFVDLGDARNVVPILDSGEFKGHWVLVMPRAETSLRRHLAASGGALDLTETDRVLRDVLNALVDLDGRVVHRDIKPDNVLLLDGHWCLADFGISRYAEATTAPDTHKFAFTAPYAAPEQWRYEHATSAADLYAVGVLAYELIAGSWPFQGPAFEDFRDQHLHKDPPRLNGVPTAFASLIEECLFKAAGARPSPANVRARLDRLQAPSSPGLARLQEANRAEIGRQAEHARQQSAHQSDAERRDDLFAAAERSFEQVGLELVGAIKDTATAVKLDWNDGGWSIRLGSGHLKISPPRRTAVNPWGRSTPAFEVIAHASIALVVPTDRYGYSGRSHSLWFCDAIEDGRFQWYETTFMFNPFVQQRKEAEPFALDPGEAAAEAVGSGITEYQLAWDFTPLTPGDLDEFIDRWASWLALAADRQLHHPSQMPERLGEYRKN